MVNISFQDQFNQTITLYQTPSNLGSYFALTTTQGLFESDTEISVSRVPRTDFFQTNSILATQKVRTFSGMVKGINAKDMIRLRQTLAGLKGIVKDFRVDLYLPHDLSTIFESYKFSGYIKSFQFVDVSNDANQFVLTVVSDDPFIYSFATTTLTKELELTGRSYPLVYPKTYGSETNTITYQNLGNSKIMPIWTVRNRTDNFRIKNNITNRIFQFGLSTVDGQTLTLNTQTRRATLNGQNVLTFVRNFDALVIDIGDNSWSILTDTIENTEVEVSFNQTFISI